MENRLIVKPEMTPVEALMALSKDIEFDRRINDEIREMRAKVLVLQIGKGYFKCVGSGGIGIAEKKDAALFNESTHERLIYCSYRKHLYAIHAALKWALTKEKIKTNESKES